MFSVRLHKTDRGLGSLAVGATRGPDGQGPSAVLAHGFAISLDEWNVIAEALVAGGHRVIAFDQRGHGRTTIGSDGVGSRQTAGDYAAVLEGYDVSDGVLVMHSMGGFVGSRLLVPGAEHTVNWEAADVVVAEIGKLAGPA